MSEKEFKWDDITADTIFQTGECIKKEEDFYYCYIIVEVKDKSLVLINIFDGQIIVEQKQDIIKANYKRVAINAIVYRLLSSKNPLSKILTNYPKSALDNIARDYAMQLLLLQNPSLMHQNQNWQTLS